MNTEPDKQRKEPRMPVIIDSKPEFQTLSEREIVKALADPDPNPIKAELARLINAYTGNSGNWQNDVECLSRLREIFLYARPRWPIPSATRPKRLIVVATRSKSAVR